MNTKKYLLAVAAITLSLCICVCVIIYAAQDKNNQLNSEYNLSFPQPVSLEIQPTDYSLLETSASREEFFILHYANEETAADSILPEGVTIASGDLESTSSPLEEVTEAALEETTNDLEDNSTDDTISSPGLDSNYNFVTVTQEYFDDAVFIGNSRLQGFILYSKLPDLCSYTYVGMSVKSYFTKESFTVNGVSLTAAGALEATPGFKKVYLKLGINELGWVSTEQFIESYSQIIEHIYSCNPDAIIFINSVLPVSQEAIAKDPTLSKEKILEYNEAIKAMADQYGACYLDAASVFTGEDGYMPYSYSFDGVHLNADSIQLWLNYLLEHGIEEN